MNKNIISFLPHAVGVFILWFVLERLVNDDFMKGIKMGLDLNVLMKDRGFPMSMTINCKNMIFF